MGASPYDRMTVDELEDLIFSREFLLELAVEVEDADPASVLTLKDDLAMANEALERRRERDRIAENRRHRANHAEWVAQLEAMTPERWEAAGLADKKPLAEALAEARTQQERLENE